MIGQSVINVKSGGRGRLSALVAGGFLMFLILVLGNVVVQIPMAALAGVMIMVSISTFDWNSVRTLHKLPRTDAIVLVSTIAIVLVTHNLAYGVLAGVLLSMVFFRGKNFKSGRTVTFKSNVNRSLLSSERPIVFCVHNEFPCLN